MKNREGEVTKAMKRRMFGSAAIIVLLVTMIMSLTTVANATNTPTITIDKAQGTVGKTVSVNLSISDNPGFAGATFKVVFDNNVLTLDSVTYNEAGFGKDFEPIGNYSSPVKIAWSSMSDVTSNGIFLTLNFMVKETAPVGDTVNISVVSVPGDFCNISEKDVYFDAVDGSVMIIKGVPGDITGDGLVNSKDLIRLRKFFSGWDVETDMIACDCNGDGNINSKDLIRLRKKFSGWDVKLFYGPMNTTVGCDHALNYTSASSPKCDEDGNTEYWHCTKCGRYFSDADGKSEITLASTVLNAIGHTYSTTWSSDDNAHWHSAICEHTSEVSDYSEHFFDEGVCTICAYTQIPTYTVTFVDYNNTIIEIQEVKEGLDAVAPDNPARVNYTFAGWNTSFTNVSEDITVKATYIRQYTVTFVDYNGTVLKTQVVNSGSNAIAPPHPTRTEYDSNGWDKAYTNITANTTVTALYKIKTFTVTFKMPDGTIIPYVDYKGVEHSTQTIEYGSCAEVPNYSDIFTELYFDWDTTSMKKFSGWDKVLTNITNNTVVTAEYNDYYNQPVVAIEQNKEVVQVKIYMPVATHLYALDFSFDWVGSIGISNYSIDETSNVLYLSDNISKSIDYNNKQKTFHYSWTCAKGVKVPNNDEYFDVVEITFSTSGGSQLDVESIQKNCTLVFGATSDLPIEQLIIINPIVVIK